MKSVFLFNAVLAVFPIVKIKSVKFQVGRVREESIMSGLLKSTNFADLFVRMYPLIHGTEKY